GGDADFAGGRRAKNGSILNEYAEVKNETCWPAGSDLVYACVLLFPKDGAAQAPYYKGKLRLLKCVVLEACETGLGKLSAETSFGLTRALSVVRAFGTWKTAQ